MTEQEKQRKQNNEIIAQLREIRLQNIEVLKKLDERNKTAAKAGAVAGAVSGGVIAVGVEFIRLKLGL